jgi:hypothetical protein
MKLTPAQEQAVQFIKELGLTQFACVYNPATGREVSKPTLRALNDKGIIRIVRTVEYKYTVRGRFGRGIRWNKTKSEVLYEVV